MESLNIKDSVLELARELIKIPSITPNDNGIQELLIKRLETIGFEVERLPFAKVSNFFARYGKKEPLLVFAGHTDVVPVGDELAWSYPPFAAIKNNGFLYGRGSADMKGAIAAMVVAVEEFLATNGEVNGSIGFLITSDEEGDAIDGTKRVIEHLNSKNININYCLIGEPSSSNILGDTIKNGRRGSLNGKLIIIGKQGHIAYPHLANNAIHLTANALNKLCNKTWDSGNKDFPATSFQISNIKSGTGANNVIPASCDILFNFRYSTQITHNELKNTVGKILDDIGLKYELVWQHSGYPFLTKQGKLTNIVSNSINKIMAIETKLSTTGGTSDGRFIAPFCTQVIELGVLNTTIHQVDECVAIDDLYKLSCIYKDILANVF